MKARHVPTLAGISAVDYLTDPQLCGRLDTFADHGS
jgi:hypothetical protein